MIPDSERFCFDLFIKFGFHPSHSQVSICSPFIPVAGDDDPTTSPEKNDEALFLVLPGE